ncbi:hypothetical protein WR25_12453 [Diploscapter pachys]|uniref:Chitin synthase chs-1/2 N-terminal putative transporter domain-containing protein n=1 Tax=Diploscapter pachys TaxID=2018661 RepID=A0A2A2LKK3_9BILA|nr:hypothetical protein WR25_12453 [Diploscapter pachys]
MTDEERHWDSFRSHKRRQNESAALSPWMITALQSTKLVVLESVRSFGLCLLVFLVFPQLDVHRCILLFACFPMVVLIQNCFASLAATLNPALPFCARFALGPDADRSVLSVSRFLGIVDWSAARGHCIRQSVQG